MKILCNNSEVRAFLLFFFYKVSHIFPLASTTALLFGNLFDLWVFKAAVESGYNERKKTKDTLQKNKYERLSSPLNLWCSYNCF